MTEQPLTAITRGNREIYTYTNDLIRFNGQYFSLYFFIFFFDGNHHILEAGNISMLNLQYNRFVVIELMNSDVKKKQTTITT